MNSDSLCSLAGRYDNPFPSRFLSPIDCLKIPALSKVRLKLPLQVAQEDGAKEASDTKKKEEGEEDSSEEDEDAEDKEKEDSHNEAKVISKCL